MRKLSILLTNNTLSGRHGTETYVRDVALALLRRGHRPVAYSRVLGAVADDLRRATVPVIDDIARLGEPPDVIHGHHHFETLVAALAFPSAPIVHFCHGWLPWEEAPLRHPSIRRYVAVDDVCRDRLVREEGVRPERVELVLNFVDLARFQPRPGLPTRPARALVFSNQATDDGYARAIASACGEAGVALDVVGSARGNAATSPETLLARYDVVFAKARSALEAMAVGCAVVLADAVGGGPLVTPRNVAGLRANNFGIRELRQPHSAGWYAEQLSAYSADSAFEVSGMVRSEAGLEAAVDRLLSIYARAIDEPPDDRDPLGATVAHLQRIALPFKESSAMSARVQTLSGELELARTERDALEARLRAIEVAIVDRELIRAERDSLRTLLDLTRERELILEQQLNAFHSLPTLRVRDALLRIPVVGPVVRTTARRLAKLLD
jgi:glycosyltransferase involved in cell wall biosynthesis